VEIQGRYNILCGNSQGERVQNNGTPAVEPMVEAQGPVRIHSGSTGEIGGNLWETTAEERTI